MPTCRICLRNFKSLKFQTKCIEICTRCVTTLNESPEPAGNAEARFAGKLARGMQRTAERDLKSDEEWKRRRAQHTLDNINVAVAAKLHDWITRLLSDPNNSTRDFKIMRAYRRDLLRKEVFADRPSEEVWKKVSQRIRHRDDGKCKACGATNTILDVHHIIYLSRHGTNNQNNLITLCRKCHDAEHDGILDPVELQDLERASPLRPHTKPSVPPQSPSQTLSAPALVKAPIPSAPASIWTPASAPHRQTLSQHPDEPTINVSPAVRGRERVGITPNRRIQKWKAILGATTAGIAVILLVTNIPQTYLSDLNISKHSGSRDSAQLDNSFKLDGQLINIPENSRLVNNSPLQSLRGKPNSEAPAQSSKKQEQQVISDHYQKIYAAHPDADFLVSEQDFKRWADTPKKQRVMELGTIEEVIQLFNDYKIQKIELDMTRHFERAGVLPENDKATCIFKSIMTDADYQACGISPPSL